MAKKVAANPATDATMPDVSVVIKGKTYHLVFTYGALSIADRKLAPLGRKLSLIEAVDWKQVTTSQLEVLWFAALQGAHPDIAFEEAAAMITIVNSGRIFAALARAYQDSMSEPDEDANPPSEPAAE